MDSKNKVIECLDVTSVNSKILELWSKTQAPYNLQQSFKDPTLIAPLLYPNLKTNSILFVGLNPSFSLTALSKHHKKSEDEIWDYYNATNTHNKKGWIKEVEEASENYSYFKKFDPIKNEMNAKIPDSIFDWEHIDLLLVRKTQQNEMLKQLGLHNINDPHDIQDSTMKEFVLTQIDFFRKLLRELYPKIIVVVNAKASRIFKEAFDPKWNDDAGCYITSVEDRSVQTHLTGMLTGQRALDNESYNSLKWNILHSYKTLKRPNEV